MPHSTASLVKPSLYLLTILSPASSQAHSTSLLSEHLWAFVSIRITSGASQKRFPIDLWTKNDTCHISKQRMFQPTSHHTTATPTVSPERSWGGNRMPDIKPSATAAAPWWYTLRRLRMRKHMILTQTDEMHIKGMISISPDSLIFPYINFLTWDACFSLINNNLFMFWLPDLCCKNSCISWLLLHLFGAVP